MGVPLSVPLLVHEKAVRPWKDYPTSRPIQTQAEQAPRKLVVGVVQYLCALRIASTFGGCSDGMG